MTPRPFGTASASTEAAVASLRTPPPPPPPVLIRWFEAAAATIGIAAIAAGALTIVGTPTWLLAAICVLGAAIGLAIAVLGWRTNRRRAEAVSLTTVLGQLLRTPIIVHRIRWKGWPVGRIVALRVQYVDLAAAAYGPQLAWSIAASSAASLRPSPTQWTRHHRAKRQVWLTEKAPTAKQAPTALEAQQQRVRDVVAETFGADAKVEITATKDDLVTGFAIDYRSAAPRATVVAVRRRLSNAVGERLTGQWKVNFDLENDRVSFKRRPPLPTYIARSSTPPPKPGDACVQPDPASR